MAGGRRVHKRGPYWLLEVADDGGGFTYVAEWSAGGQVMRRELGPKRIRGRRPGLSARKARRALEAVMREDAERLVVELGRSSAHPLPHARCVARNSEN